MNTKNITNVHIYSKQVMQINAKISKSFVHEREFQTTIFIKILFTFFLQNIYLETYRFIDSSKRCIMYIGNWNLK